MSDTTNIQVVLRCFDGRTSGDSVVLMSTLVPDVVHYFLPAIHKPIRGAEYLSRYWRKFQKIYSPTWRHDHTIASGDVTEKAGTSIVASLNDVPGIPGDGKTRPPRHHKPPCHSPKLF
jgi:hypothetical protein